MSFLAARGSSGCGFCQFDGERLALFAGKTQIGSKCGRCGGVLRFSKKELLANLDTQSSPVKLISSLFRNPPAEPGDKPKVIPAEGDEANK
jgi:hypothetical protein